MRIALFTEASAAGVGRHVIDLAEALTALGHECHVLYGAGRLDRRFAERVVKLAHSRALDVRTNPHPSDLGVIRQARRYFKQHGPFDILHAHSTKAGFLLRPAAVGIPGAVLYTPHAPLTMNPRLPLAFRVTLALLELLLSGVTDKVIAVSTEEANHLAAYLPVRSKISVVPNGIAQTCAPDRKHTGGEPDLRIGFLGRLSPQKNAGMLLDAFALSFGLASKATLTIAGSGPEERNLRAQANRLGIAERIHWVADCASEIISSFDVFALPSAYEGLPYVLLEALSAGVPVVATAVGGVRSVIRDGMEGFIVNPGNTEQFASALRRLALDRSLRKRMSHRARITASRFTVYRMAVETVQVYKQVLRLAEPDGPVRTLPLAAD